MQIIVKPLSDHVTGYLVSKMRRQGFYRESLTGSFVEIGQETVCKGVDAESSNVITDIDEELVPALCLVSLFPVLDCISLIELGI
jgi:hypothetical protein